jgi:hypothetical protein
MLKTQFLFLNIYNAILCVLALVEKEKFETHFKSSNQQQKKEAAKGFY